MLASVVLPERDRVEHGWEALASAMESAAAVGREAIADARKVSTAAVTGTSTGMPSDHTLLARAAREGDRAAFGALYGRYARMVHGVLLSRVPHAEVEVLVQEVFLLALRRMASLRDPDAFGGWLASIARNLANDYHRNPQSREKEELPEDLRQANASSAWDMAEAQRVMTAIRRLPEAYRETLVLRLVEGMTGPEIAERTGLTADSVRVNLHRDSLPTLASIVLPRARDHDLAPIKIAIPDL